MKKNKVIILTSIIVGVLVVTLGLTYAAITFNETKGNSQLVLGDIYMHYGETNSILLDGVMPGNSYDVGNSNSYFEFTISGKNTYTKKDIWYEIVLSHGNIPIDKTEINRIQDKYLKFRLVEVTGGTEIELFKDENYGDLSNQRIYVQSIPKNTSEEIKKTYRLYMIVSNDLVIGNTDNAVMSFEEYTNSFASIKVSVSGDFKEKNKPIYLAKEIEKKEFSNLLEPDVDGTRFLNGSNVSNNYVWYSGKLWRVVAINKDDSIKLITENAVSAVSYSISNESYENSQIRSWLNTEFLPTLSNSENLIIDANWDFTVDKTVDIEKPKMTSYVSEKVGLLTLYESVMTGASDDAEKSNTFLNNNNYSMWLITPNLSNNSFIKQYGERITNGASYISNGIRPVINFKPWIEIDGGNGTLDDPYRIKGDKKIFNNELLNNRVSGEYIEFNNTLYRIVGTETLNNNLLTKVVMADYNINGNNLTNNQAFGDTATDKTYNTSTGIGKYLNDWYSGTSISREFKDMIETNVYWYTGPDNGTGFDYTLSKTGTTIVTPIGLGYYGEMFSSHFGYSDNISDFWLMTKYDSSRVHHANIYGSTFGFYPPGYPVTKQIGVRPSLYLKSEVIITGGTGLPNDPYILNYSN